MMNHNDRKVIKFPSNWKGESRREITACWNAGDGREVRMNVYHYPERKLFSVFIGDHKVEGNSITCSPMAHTRVVNVPAGRYSKKALEKVFDEYVDHPDVKRLVKHYADNPTI